MKHLRAALTACGAAAVLLTGCGVQETRVIEAGGPATVLVLPTREERLLLFFLSPQGRPTPVTRPVKPAGEDPGKKAVSTSRSVITLLDGPRANERAAGLRTGLPDLKGSLQVESSPGTVQITAPFAVRRLERNAVQQLVCTAAFAEGRADRTEVTLRGRDGTLRPTSCEAVPSEDPSR
ncbi:hypothetical protein [Streptomyces sp. NPDC048639]|uniref:hypothetical protein n=1 Tax=Streptomyces sp. NPDC048639 TaxID=3365581 RepID=UPI003716BBFA